MCQINQDVTEDNVFARLIVFPWLPAMWIKKYCNNFAAVFSLVPNKEKAAENIVTCYFFCQIKWMFVENF